jgi:hypothetical protein
MTQIGSHFVQQIYSGPRGGGAATTREWKTTVAIGNGQVKTLLH